MKKFIILATLLLTLGIANANAGVSFEISIGDKHHHGKHGRGYTERHYAPRYAPPRHAPRYVVRECSHGYYGDRHHGRRHNHGYRGHHGHRH